MFRYPEHLNASWTLFCEADLAVNPDASLFLRPRWSAGSAQRAGEAFDETGPYRGTGCALASSQAVSLAQGLSVPTFPTGFALRSLASNRLRLVSANMAASTNAAPGKYGLAWGAEKCARV